MIASVVYEMLRDKISHLILGKSIDFYVDFMDFHKIWPKDSRVNVDVLPRRSWQFCTNKTPREQNRQHSLCADVSLFPLLHSRLTREI